MNIKLQGTENLPRFDLGRVVDLDEETLDVCPNHDLLLRGPKIHTHIGCASPSVARPDQITPQNVWAAFQFRRLPAQRRAGAKAAACAGQGREGFEVASLAK